MSEMSPPAITAEEWKTLEGAHYAAGIMSILRLEKYAEPTSGRRILALANQYAGPQGEPLFTWDDVDHHRQLAQELGAAESRLSGARPPVSADPDLRSTELAEWHRSMAERLAALLPPR